MTSPLSKMRTWSLLAGVVLVIGSITGCQTCGRPCEHRQALSMDVTTPSADAARAADVTPRELVIRSFATMDVKAKGGAVAHGPLFYEDPFESDCCDDDRFAVTGLDHLSWMLGTARFVVNTAMYPVTMVVTPHCLAMTSDGVPSRCVIGLEPQDASRP